MKKTKKELEIEELRVLKDLLAEANRALEAKKSDTERLINLIQGGRKRRAESHPDFADTRWFKGPMDVVFALSIVFMITYAILVQCGIAPR